MHCNCGGRLKFHSHAGCVDDHGYHKEMYLCSKCTTRSLVLLYPFVHDSCHQCGSMLHYQHVDNQGFCHCECHRRQCND